MAESHLLALGLSPFCHNLIPLGLRLYREIEICSSLEGTGCELCSRAAANS